MRRLVSEHFRVQSCASAFLQMVEFDTSSPPYLPNQVCYISEGWALCPFQSDNKCGAALDSGSRNELQLGHYIICTLPPGEDYISFFSVGR
jgi:hypothetical protein